MNLNLDSKKILIVGFGETGISCTDFLLGKNCHITVNDSKSYEELNKITPISYYEKKGVKFILKEHPTNIFYDADLIILSPGVPPDKIPIKEITEKGIPIISEIELAYSFCKGKIIGITGTNGKTTVSTLLGLIFKNANYSTCVCGNIGFPFIKAINQEKEFEYYIIELSSFQLERIESFKPKGALLLNITPDHLDRYESQQDYAKAKLNLFINQDEKDWAIINADYSHYLKGFINLKPSLWKFSLKELSSKGCYLKNDYIYFKKDSEEKRILDLNKIKLKGIHNIENIMACVLASLLENIGKEIIEETIYKFEGLPHRMEFVKEKDGIIFINDSKATNTDAVIKALESFQKNVVLILGGKDKHLNYDDLTEAIKKHVKAAILLGETKEIIYKAIKNTNIKILFAGSMSEAVKKAYENSQAGDIVLLSPACSSFDMFKDYADRGNIFKEEVNKL